MRGMNQKRKRLGLWILFLAALLLTQFTVPVKASEPQIQDVNIQMVGGQIRTIDPMGLRMVACIKKSYIQELEKSGATVSYGIVLLPKKYLTEGQALTLDGKYLYNGSVYKPAKVPAVKKFSEDNDRIYFTAVLANLPKERYKNDYAARAYAEITRTVTEDDGKKKTTTEVVYSESEIDRQVYRIAEEAVNGTTETEETKQWLQDNILAPVDKPEELPEEEKKISFRLGKVSGVTLYHKTTSEAVKKEDYLVKVEMEDQPEIFAVITEVIAPQTETGKVSFKLDRKDYTTSQAGQTIEGAVVEFGTKSNDKVSTKYITMQSLIDQMKANPGGTYTLEHDIDASMVQGDDYLVPTFSGTFNGNGYKIKGLTTTLFGTVSGGKVQNVKLENVSITKVNSYKDAGGGTIANKAQKDAVIENVHVSGSLKSTNSRELLGGLVGRMDYAKVSKCSANLEITGSFNTTGGLIGQMSNQNEGPNIVENSYAVGSIRGNRTNGALGGLIGWHNCKTNFSVTNCYAAINMELTGTNRQPGGFIGYIGEADATGVLKSNVSYSTGNAGYKFDGSNHEMGHVTDMWIWMENKGKRPGRNGEDYSNGYANQANVDYNMNFMKTYARDGSMVTNLTPDRINTQEEFKSYYKEVFETIYTLDYLQGKAYLELTPAQQSAITSQHRYGTTNNYQSRNQSNSTWRTIGAAELENMNLKTLDDLWDNQLTIRPGHRFDLRSMNDVGVNNLGAYQIDRVCYASWYVPYVDGGTPNAQTFRRNGYELGGLYGYSDGLVEYLSNRTQTGDLAYFKKKMQDENFSFETYRKNKNKEIEEKIKKQKEQGNAYFDEEALIEYLKQNMINYGNGINSGVSTGNNTLNNIKESRENVFRYLQRITDEFRSPVYADTAESRHAVTISTGQELIEKINENPNGFYVLEKDISMADINLTGEVYIDKTFIGKLQGNGHKITDAQGPLFAKIANSYVSDLTIVNKEGETKDWFGKTKQYTIIVNEQKKETVQEIKTLEELKTVGQNKYTKYVLKNDIDASSVTTETAVVKGIFKGEFDGGGFTIKGLKKPLFEKVQEGTVRNLKIENAEINSTEESSKNAVITKESNHAVFESLNLADIKVSGVSYNAVVTGYDYTSSVFSKIQIRNAQITGTKNYNAVLAGRASGSQIQDVSVIGSSVALSGTDCGGFIGEGKNVTISRVYSDADMTVNTYTDDKNRTQSAGFIGNLTGKSSVEYVFAAGKVDNKTSEQLYNFIGTPDALKTMVKNSFVIQNAGGVSNITDGVGQEILREVTSQEAATSDFYKTSMTLNEETWNLSLVPMKGYPELKGMEKREVISVKTAEDFMKMKDFPTQEYRLKADIDLSGTEQTGSVIPEFSGVLDGENHKITGLKAPLFGQLSGTVSNVAIDAGAIEIGNSVDTTVGIFANTMTNATVEKVMIANGSISSTAGKAAGFAGTVTDSTVKNIFIQGRVNAVSTASGFAETSHHSVMENIYANIDVNGADGAGFLVNSTGENSYKNICSIGNVAENMYKLAKTDITFTNAYELSAADGISSAAEANGVKTIGKEVWTKAFYTETLKLDISVWDVENAETNGYPLLKEFNVNLSPMTVEIQKPQDIRKLNKLPEGRFTITADLDFTEYGAAEITENIAENSIENNADINAADSVENSAENHAEETAQAGTCLVTETFTGSINGGGHKVSGMKSAMFKQLSGKVENLEFRNILVDNETAGANVLAETTHNANVKNVHFNGITLRGAGYTGMIGKDTGSTFSQISVQNADVTTRADYAGVFAANAAGTQIFDVLITDTEVATSNAYVGGFIGNAERITAQKVFADAELDIPYTVSPQNTAAFIGQASEDSKIQYSTAAGGVYPEDPSSTRYKLTHMDNSSNLNELKAFTNCFINTDTPGYDSIANDPKGVTHEALCGTEFYTNEMRLSQDVWDLSDVAGTGTPSLKTMPEEDVRAPETAPTPEEEIPMQETAPEGYTEIRTAEELLAIRDSSDKYILMSSISLYDAEPQDGSFLGDFKGELNGNGLTIREVYGAPLFNTLSGKVENLKLTDVKVEAWSQNQGANAFAKTLSGATVSKVALKNILVAGGNNTGALAGTAQNSTVSEVWAEGLNVNPYGPIHGQNDAMVGGLIAKLKGGCHISDSYVGGEITVNGETQGGVFGYNSNMDNGPENTVKQVVSNMKTKAISGQTDGAGFIGMIGYDYSWSTWMKNSIAIGEASVNREHGSIGEAYRFTSTTGYSMREGLENCYEAKVGGKSNISPGDLDETSRYKEKSFYQDTLKFDSSKWSFTSVEQKGHPTLSWIAGAEPLPPLPEGSAVTTHKQLKTEVPQGYTAIRTPADFMKIAENPSGKYILMNNISLEQVKLAEGQTSYIMKRFEGELDGNNQVIHGLRASLFDSISGTSSKKAVVKNLRVQNVFVNAGYKDIFDWQGKPVLAEANGLAREVSNGRLETIYMNCVKLNGGGNTGALGGLVNETYIGKVWLEGIDINSGLSEEELGRFNLVGGAVGSLSGYNSKFEDSYVEGKIIMDNNQQGGVAGQVKAAVVRNVISNVEARSNKPDSWTEKSGFVGDVNTSLQYDNRWYLDRCISIGNSGNNYKFLGKDLKAVTKNNLNLCYEVTGKTGRSNVTDATSQSGTLLTIDNINNVELYRDTLSFNDNTAQADPNAWDFSSVAEKGYPTLTWLLTYDGAAATMVEQTPVQDQEQEAAQDENLAEAEVNLPEQDEYLKED